MAPERWKDLLKWKEEGGHSTLAQCFLYRRRSKNECSVRQLHGLYEVEDCHEVYKWTEWGFFIT